ncbi:MAG: hypothetical protein IJS39_04445 [Synergistaceae bacterium]|nr:hypothetical protein [Synergistaceae bacterium]
MIKDMLKVYPCPWHAESFGGGFVVADVHGRSIAMNCRTADEDKAAIALMARAPELLSLINVLDRQGELPAKTDMGYPAQKMLDLILEEIRNDIRCLI